MAIDTCRLIGIEGAHGTGKSTLALAVAAECKRRHMHAGCLVERARQSPFIEDAVIHKTGPITIHGELHLVALQIAHEQGLARHHDLLICDKTVANVLGYSRLLLSEGDSRSTRDLLHALQGFLSEYAKFYDQVFYSGDLYDLQLTRDPFRPVDPKFQRDAANAISEACTDLKIPLVLIPTGLDHQKKVHWVVERILDRT